MAVAFTTNVGLAKPDQTELALNWARVQELQDDNNIIIADKMDVNLVSYTPLIAATTTAPSIGAGVIRGEYQNMQGIVQGSMVIEFTDPGVAVGVGEYAFSLPFPADNTYHAVGTTFNAVPGQYSVIGEGYIHDATVINNRGTVALDVVTVATVSYVRLITEAYAGKTNRLFAPGLPFNVATGDKFSLDFVYKRT